MSNQHTRSNLLSTVNELEIAFLSCVVIKGQCLNFSTATKQSCTSYLARRMRTARDFHSFVVARLEIQDDSLCLDREHKLLFAKSPEIVVILCRQSF